MPGGAKNELIKVVMERNPCGERPLGRPKTSSKTCFFDLIKKDVESLGRGTNWKERAIDREGRRNVCV